MKTINARQTKFVIIQCIEVTVQIAPIIRQFKAQNGGL